MKMLIALTLVLAAGTASASCREGDVQYWPSQAAVSHGDGDSAAVVPWICRNGAYVEQYGAPARAATTPMTCKEGTIEFFPDDGPDAYLGENGPTQVPYICRNGGFVNQFNPKPSLPAGKAPRCKEGRIESFVTGGDDGTPPTVEILVCKNGVLRRIQY